MKRFVPINCTRCKVGNCPIQKYCTSEWKKIISDSKIVASYKKGQPIIKEDTFAAGVYIIYSGRVLIISERRNFNKQIIRLAKPGDVLEHKSTNEEIKNPFTAEAFEDTAICFIPKATFFQLLKKDREFPLHLERIYTENFIRVEERLKNILVMNARAKIADALLMVADSFNGNIPFSRKELGELIGISADQVSRELKKLMEDGIVEKVSKNKKIVVSDFSKLLSIVNEYDEDYSVHLENGLLKSRE